MIMKDEAEEKEETYRWTHDTIDQPASGLQSVNGLTVKLALAT